MTKILTAFAGYTPRQFGKDLLAGVLVAIIAIPLSIAFGIGSGVSPAQGLLTAIVGGFLISFFGGSRVQIGGPTGAFIVIVYGIVVQFGVRGLLVATLMAGIILVCMGIFRFGSVIRFIPQPIIVGFTAGIAVVIFSAQLKDALGLPIAAMPPDFVDKMIVVGSGIGHTNVWALIICAGTLGLILTLKKILPAFPAAFVALILASLAAWFFNLPVSTIGSSFGTVSLTLSPVSFAGFAWKDIIALLGPAFSIAFLGAIESLLSAVVADAMIGTRHRPNTELIAQGFANIASSLVGGIPATGAIARTAANIRSGGRTPVAGIFHSIVLLVIVVFLAPLTSLIPLASLAGILIGVALNMGEWKEFRIIGHTSRRDAIALWATFLVTIFVDLVFAIGAGLIICSYFFIRSMSEKSTTQIHTDLSEDIDSFKDQPEAINHFVLPPGCISVELDGPFFFGAATKFEESIRTILENSRVLIMRFTRLDLIDATGIQVLRRIVEDSQARKIRIILTEIPDSVTETLLRAGILELVGRRNCLPTMVDAIHAASRNSSSA